MLELKHEPVLPIRQFVGRLLGFTAAALLLVVIALGIGVGGYYWIAGLGFVDALLNASMILGGMGPVDPLRGDAAKLFASVYALFSGLVFLTVAAMLFTPLVHRMLHRFHVDETGQ